MKTYSCVCGNKVYFENTSCLACTRQLGFLPDHLDLGVFDQIPGPEATSREHYRRCANSAQHRNCNWMVPAGDPNPLCASCRLNQVIPDLSDPRRLELWSHMEIAKRRLLYSLIDLDLPIEPKHTDPDGIAFRILSDDRLDLELATKDVDGAIMTGFDQGTITINLLEADSSMREAMRHAMNESYRTLLGHFRHESGHYYFSRLVTGDTLIAFRSLFGDERADYRERLNQYYGAGTTENWRGQYVAAYAASHPLEDFAETWAHYLHMVDTLETAVDGQVDIGGRSLASPTGHLGFQRLFDDWVRLTGVLNQLNRSLGVPDAYPFVLGAGALNKLRFIHELIETYRVTPRRTAASR